MKILLATPLYAPQIGGPATHAKFVTEELSRRGFVVERVEFGAVRSWPRLLRHLLYLYTIVRRGKTADVIYALDPVSVGLPAMLAARWLKKRFVLRVAGDYAWEQGVQRFGVTDHLDRFLATKRVPIRVRILRRIQTSVARGAARIVVPSAYFKSVIERWGIPGEKVEVVYSTLEPLTVLQKYAARKAIGVFNSDPLIVSAGRLVPWKGFHKLLDAVAQLRKQFPALQLRIAGDGPGLAKLRAAIAEAGLEGAVHLEGKLSQQDLAALVSAADVFVLNTQYEGLSHQLIEAMQIGTPIVTTPVGGNPELLQDGKSALFVEQDDVEALASAVAHLLTHRAFAEHLVAGARATLSRFEPARSAEALANLFMEAMPTQAQLRVLMISGDPAVLQPGSNVHERIQLQAAQIGWLDVLVQGRGQATLAGKGSVEGFVGSKFSVARAMLRAAHSRRFHVVTSQDPFLLGLIAWRIARRSRAKLELQIHTDLFAPEYAALSWGNWLRVRLARFLLVRADGVRVVSERIARSLVPLRLTVPISVLPIYVNIDAVRAAPLCDTTVFPPFSKRILVVSRLEREKNVAGALRVMREVLKSIPDAGLLIAGDGSERASLEALARKLGIAKRVVFLGRRDDALSLYTCADVVLSTSYYEGYGAVLIEALAAGRAVVTPDVGIAREAGAIVVPRKDLARATVEALRTYAKGKLLLPVVSKDAHARAWGESIAHLL